MIPKAGYYNHKGIFIEYEVTYYCNENKLIHSLSQYKQCKYCNIKSPLLTFFKPNKNNN